jgi:hypothetical protein
MFVKMKGDIREELKKEEREYRK